MGYRSYFSDWINIPQIYVLVDKIEKLQKKSDLINITPTVLFSFDPRKFDPRKEHLRFDYDRRTPDFGVSYVTCYPNDTDYAANWIESYVDEYGKSILTNFDQQSAFWRNVPFSIQRIMAGELSSDASIYIGHANIERVNELNARETVMSKKIEIHVIDSGKLEIKGDLIIADEISSSFNKTNGISNDQLKELMQELTIAVGKMSENLPEDTQKEIAQDLDILATESSKDQPQKRRWEFSVEGLKKAAQSVGEIGKPVLELVAKIVQILSQQ